MPTTKYAIKKQREKIFVAEYLVDFNGKAAAIRAGYSTTNASSRATQLLMRADIQAELLAQIQARRQRLEISRDRVLREIATVAFLNVNDYTVDAHGVVNGPADDPDCVRAVSGVRKRFLGLDENKKPIYCYELKFWDKIQALTMLAKHLGLLKDQVEITGAIAHGLTLEDLLAARAEVLQAAPAPVRALPATPGAEPASAG